MESQVYIFLEFVVLITTFAVITAVIFRIAYLFQKNKVPFIFKNQPLPALYKNILKNKFPYYNKLNDEEKMEFERRVYNFLSNKNFVPMHKLKKVTAEMKALISACAVQLTFGLEDIYFVHFHTILVFPDAFFSNVTKAKHLGEVNEQGIIAFSWKTFQYGYKNEQDTLNVGLHEMAHALSLENIIQNQEYHFLDEKDMNNWKNLADAEYQKMRQGGTSFLRKYAGSKRSEFFPVCIEHFFERPDEFFREAPELYNALAKLLKQDPLERLIVSNK